MKPYQVLTIQVTPEMHKRLRQEAYENDTDMAAIIRQELAKRYQMDAAQHVYFRTKQEETKQ